MYKKMLLEHTTAFILSVLLLSIIPLTFSKMNTYKEDNNEIVGNTATLSDDEISYALSELSVDDLNTLSKLIDVFSQEGEIKDKAEINSEDMSEEQTRFKRESSDASAKHDQNNLLSNVNEVYIRQLEDSFPNIIDQPNQEGKEKNHIRVKRH